MEYLVRFGGNKVTTVFWENGVLYPGMRVKGRFVQDVKEGPWREYRLDQISAIIAGNEAAVVSLDFICKVMGGAIDDLIARAEHLAPDHKGYEQVHLGLKSAFVKAMQDRGESEVFRANILAAYVMNAALARGRLARAVSRKKGVRRERSSLRV